MPCCVDGLRDGDPVHSDGCLFRSGTSVRCFRDVAASLVPAVAAAESPQTLRRPSCQLLRQWQSSAFDVAASMADCSDSSNLNCSKLRRLEGMKVDCSKPQRFFTSSPFVTMWLCTAAPFSESTRGGRVTTRSTWLAWKA